MKALAALVLLLTLAACSGEDDDGDDGTGGAVPVPTRTSAPEEPDEPEVPSEIDLSDTEVCGLVRDGVDAFNLGDVEGTIDIFEGAVGPAEDLARDEPSAATESLLEAVRYYAELPADEYVEANVSSPEFQKYKAFTLTACAYAGPPDGATPTDPGIPA